MIAEKLLGVKLYETMPADCEENLLGISPKIPAKVVNLEKNPEYLQDETYLQMTEKDYNDYNKSLSVEYAEWKAIQEAQPVEIPQE